MSEKTAVEAAETSTLAAIEHSLGKWLDIVSKIGLPEGREAYRQPCALCERFVQKSGGFDNNCSGCPLDTIGEKCFDEDSKFDMAYGRRHGCGEARIESALEMVGMLVGVRNAELEERKNSNNDERSR